MSADAYLLILCDRPGCEYPEGHWPVRFEPHNHAELRRLLKRRGWTRTRDGRDFCPEHPEEKREAMTDQPTGTCQVCGRRFRLRKDGTVWQHNVQKLPSHWYRTPLCPGTRKQPAA